MRRSLPALILIALFSLAAGRAQAQFQPNRYVMPLEAHAPLVEARDHLKRTVDDLRARVGAPGGPRADQLADVEIFLDGVDRCLAQDLFFSAQNVRQARDCLLEGESR